MPVQPYYAIQPAFTGGEVSPDIASRVDLDKYQLLMLRAGNAIVRPYGAVRRRPGTIYCGRSKRDGKVMLRGFEFTAEISYLLEFGQGYLRIWRDGRYLGIELATPYRVADLPKLRFAQNVDVLYIASGAYQVKKLVRYNERSWALTDTEWKTPAYGDINSDEEDTLTPSGTKGTVTLTRAKGKWKMADIGRRMKLEQYIAGTKKERSVTASSSETATEAQWVEDSWKILTHGTWAGTVYVETSTDSGVTWDALRSYTGNKDYNPTETGSVEEGCLMRARGEITSGTCKMSLSVFPYTRKSEVTLTAYLSESKVSAQTLGEPLADGKSTADWYWDAWSTEDGYPSAVTFFQNRLVLGGSDLYPQRVWMSRSGQYEDFGIDKADGTVTDDSAISVDLLWLRSYRISHMEVAQDLMILTEGNMWTIGGDKTVTPTSIAPRNQENYGTNDVPPVRIGNRTVYVQRRGTIVRDTGYSYETDAYGGQDLTLLAKHLVQGYELTGSAYAQEPDSLLYFVRSDGVMLCLTYVHDQKVYGWSRIETDGAIESVAVVSMGSQDTVYVSVRREIDGAERRCIEVFDVDRAGGSQQDYVMTDCSVAYELGAAAARITGLEHLEGKAVQVMADGYFHDTLRVRDGSVTLPQAARRVTVGLPYKTEIAQLNFDAGLTETGTLQGRNKSVTGAILRLSGSFGGKVGTDTGAMVRIPYHGKQLELGDDVLYTGDLEVTLKAGGFGLEGRVYIEHEEPYPFSVSAIIRKVTVGG